MDELDNKKKLADSENKKMFRSRFDLFVLNALEDNKDGASYGYDVINYIQNKTKGHYKIKTFSTIYNTLKRLEEQNYVVSGKGDGETNGATRVYYTLTPEGRNYLEENKQEYKYMRTLLDNLLTDEDFDLDNEEAPFRATDLKPFTKRNRTDTGVVSDNGNGFDNIDDESVPSYPTDEDVSPAVQDVAPIPTETVLTVAPLSDKKPSENNPQPFVPPKKKPVSNEYKLIFEKLTAPVINSAPKKASASRTTARPKNKPAVRPSVAESNRTEKKATKENANAEVAATVAVNVEENNIEKFRNSLRSEGYALNTYRGTKSVVSSVKYVYVNKLMRDVVALSALYMIITLLVLYLLRSTFEFTLTAMLVCGSLALACALIVALIWFRNPEKRRKDTVNLKVINAICIGFFTVFFMVDLIVSLLIPNGKGLNSPSVYSPVIVASTSVFFGIIFSILYKSENYFQK